jgi:teichoic acid transport system ATP-binding protein
MVAQVETRIPVVIVENATVSYKVYASGKAVTDSSTARIKSAGNLRTVEAVKGVSLVAYQGEVIGVIGTNGSGKTSLMKAISGLTPLDKGKVFASSRPTFLGVGAAMIKELSGEKNIVLGGLAMGYSKSEINEKLDEIVEFSGLGEFVELPMRTYSAGMTERLKFSIAASRSHDILIIDEALAVGDSKFRKKSAERMKELARSAGCVFLVSHSLKTILDTCSRAIWLDNGILRADGDALEVCKAYAEEVGAELDD